MTSLAYTSSKISRGVLLLLCLVFSRVCFSETGSAGQPGNVPVTTKSEEARQLFAGGVVKLENMHGPEAMKDFRKAVQLDPDFAFADIMISFVTVDQNVDPAEQMAARDKAKAARSKISHGEQLIVDWLTSSSEGKMVAAIQAMNQAVEEYPNDKLLLWMAGIWVENQQQITRAIPMFERVLKLDPNFAPPLNEVAYCYARTRNFDKAFSAMQRYIMLLPNESNPQDSYAEILRMSGRFDDALTHYRASLKNDPNFVVSQLGLADTYALMGDEVRARTEYATAVQHAFSKSEAATWSLNAAITYIRENNRSGADAAFHAVAKMAHESDLGVLEAEAYRMMSTYQPSLATAMGLLKKAEAALQEEHKIPAAARQDETALILRERVARAAQEGNSSLAAATLKQLQQISESSQDPLIQMAYDGAAGAFLVSQGKYEEALSHLREDDRNPISMKLMVVAYRKMGAKEVAEQLAKTLAEWNEPTLEQALVVPEFRVKEPATASSFRRM
ncbi:MAG TPA: tetratricopeptide repeat protein [Candidatus Angelobacter sp.]|jgi:tetratricopeptide (TPR) repeat protein|nr:tetratricopeptide repeat protein [Candidatus Angelobacter sp.]